MKFKKDRYQLNRIINQDFLNALSFAFTYGSTSMVLSADIKQAINSFKDTNCPSYDDIRKLLKERNKERQFIKKRLKELETYNFTLSFYDRIYKSNKNFSFEKNFFIGLKYLRIRILEVISVNLKDLKDANSDINNLHKILLTENKEKKKSEKCPPESSLAPSSPYHSDNSLAEMIDTFNKNNTTDIKEIKSDIYKLEKEVNRLKKTIENFFA